MSFVLPTFKNGTPEDGLSYEGAQYLSHPLHVNKPVPVYRYFKVKFYNDFTQGKQLSRLK